MEQLTAAHRTLPFQTWVEVTNLTNGKQVDVRITDRGPFIDGRIIDLSLAAAREIDMVRAGIAKVRLRVIDPPVNRPRIIDPPVNRKPSEDVTAAGPVEVPPAPVLDDSPGSDADDATPPPATTTISSEAATPPSATPGYAVQAGAFSDVAHATALRDSLRFDDVHLVPTSGDHPLWRVVVGHNLNMDAAAALAAQVKHATGEAFVIADR